MQQDIVQRDRPRVLLVDQDQVLWQPGNGASGLSGADVVEVRDAAEVLQCIQEISPDFAILGATGSEMDRFALCTALQGLPEESRGSILVMTKYRDREAIARAFEAGADGFIPSPIDWATLDHHLNFLWRQLRSRKAIKAGEQRVLRFLNAIPDTLLRLGPGGRILDVHGSEDSEVARFLKASVDRSLMEVLCPDRSCPNAKAFENALKAGSRQFIAHDLHLDQQTLSCETLLVPGEPGEMMAIVRDVSEQRKHAEKILQSASQDALTGFQGLPAFRELLAGTMAQAVRDGRSFALLLLDLNRFQRINETFGTGAGDLVLRTFAERIVHCTRKGDRRAGFHHDDIPQSLARIGGDQFAILLEHIREARDSSKVAQRILDSMAHPFMVGENEIFITANIGIAVFPGDGRDADSLLVSAHKAMQDARERGENTFGFFAPSENAEALRELNIESSLRKALGAGELFLVYQPQVDFRTGRIIGVEALLRWEHPEWGVISPAQFIPIAERTGLIVPIGEWVLGVACLQNKIWQKAGLHSIRMAVNLSARQFRQKNLAEMVRKSLVKSSLDPSFLELEITEGTAMQKAESTVRILNELKEIGVTISIDDFGTGYSSLSYLKRFPLDVLKIDRAFIKDVHLHPDSQAIAKAILSMARSLKLSVVAEGVEAHEEVQFLKANGCDALQGYYFSPPIPALDMTRLLEESKQLVC